MSKLVVSCGTFAQGGASRVIANLSHPFADTFDHVIIVLWVKKPIFWTHTDPRAKIIFIEDMIGGKNELKKMFWFRSFINREKPDLILSFLEPYNLRVLVSTIGLGIKTIVAERNDPRMMNGGALMDWIEKSVYRLADGILVQTQTIKEFFDGDLASKTHIIYNPVNLSEDMVGKALLTPKKKRIVSAARLTPQKKLIDLIYVFNEFQKIHNDYTLTLYGEGPQEEELKALVSDLSLDDKVFIPGPSNTIHQDILDANMFVQISDREGMSNSMIEAMCLGLPCVCTKVSGAIDLIQNEYNGFLIDVGDKESLLNYINKLADNDDVASKIGEKAKDLYSILNQNVINKQWISYLLSI